MSEWWEKPNVSQHQVAAPIWADKIARRMWAVRQALLYNDADMDCIADVIEDAELLLAWVEKGAAEQPAQPRPDPKVWR